MQSKNVKNFFYQVDDYMMGTKETLIHNIKENFLNQSLYELNDLSHLKHLMDITKDILNELDKLLDDKDELYKVNVIQMDGSFKIANREETMSTFYELVTTYDIYLKRD